MTDDEHVRSDLSTLVIVAGHAGDFKSATHELVFGRKMPTLVKATQPREVLAYMDATILGTATISPTALRCTPPHFPAHHALFCAVRECLPRLVGVACVSKDGELLESWRAPCLGSEVSCSGNACNVIDAYLSSLRPVLLQHCVAAAEVEMHKYFESLGGRSALMSCPQIDGGQTLLQLWTADCWRRWSMLATSPGEVSANTSAQHALWSLQMENVVGDMTAPCVLDIKLGRVRHHPLTPLPKRDKITQQESRSLSTVHACGIRVCGAQHYFRNAQHSDGPCWKREIFDKKEGHTLLTDALSLTRFLKAFTSSSHSFRESDTLQTSSGCAVHESSLVQDIYHELCGLLDVIVAHRDALLNETAFVSCSVLIVYDAEREMGRVSHPSSSAPAAAETRRHVYLIDLARSGDRAHNYTEDTVDFLGSLKTLCSFFAPVSNESFISQRAARESL